MTLREGALNDKQLRAFISKGNILGAHDKNIGPASIDLCISEEAYRVNGMFQPQVGESIRSLLERLDVRPHDLKMPLECDVVYLAKLDESLALPPDVYGYCNAKSSTGRHDIHVRVLADGVPRYDSVTPGGFHGELWVVIIPRSYPVILPPHEPLSQLRLFNKDTRFSEQELETFFHDEGVLFTLDGDPILYEDVKISDRDGSVILTLDLESDIAGYEYIGRKNILDFGKGKKMYEASNFFEPIKVKDGKTFLKRGGFYILSTIEALRIPPHIASEMVSMDERSGEFRSHYAGFFDPGWGYGKNGEGKGRPATLEVRPFEDMIISMRHPIAKMKFERMADIPDLHYDAKMECNYREQRGAKLAKHFK